MHAVHVLLILLGVACGVTVLFFMTAGWFPQSSRPGDAARAARAGRRPTPPPVCPVSPEQREWIERSLRWCVREFGEQAARGPVVLPDSDLLPVPYDGSNYQIYRLYDRICSLMGVDPREVELRLRDRIDQAAPSDQGDQGNRHVVGRYRTPPYLRLRFLDVKLSLGRPSIEIERAQTTDPVRLVALLAHELAHRRLLGEGRVTTRQADHEQLTDLLTVYLGFGVFTANMQLGLSGHLGYLTTGERAYALACYCRMRGEVDVPSWAYELHPRPLEKFQQALEFLAFEDLVSPSPSAD
ncbi:hypothetical protein KDL01_29990 [Actinospica durhamensis]|uniref:Uncharacterized protein n=1 Tax=Actinospica durhamensis TaxID=1508375 RepID=A0A941EUN0_9ACTN|nr:hypothetical protein [Actinospica durhamensis]MBR7837548.1 hypothetical protein [Actinospica durhamensis]